MKLTRQPKQPAFELPLYRIPVYTDDHNVDPMKHACRKYYQLQERCDERRKKGKINKVLCSSR